MFQQLLCIDTDCCLQIRVSDVVERCVELLAIIGSVVNAQRPLPGALRWMLLPESALWVTVAKSVVTTFVQYICYYIAKIEKIAVDRKK